MTFLQLKDHTEEERLPYAKGWRLAASESNLLSLGHMDSALNEANVEILPGRLEITTNTVKVSATRWL
jgi:hypothetical protein